MIEIRFTDDDRPYPGALIVQGPGWENEAAYYLTLPGYRLVRIAAAIGCTRCKGRGQLRGRNRRGVRGVPMQECPQCVGYGYIGETLLPHGHIRGADYHAR